MGFHSTFINSAISIAMLPIMSKIGNVRQNHIFLYHLILVILLRSAKYTYAAKTELEKYEMSESKTEPKVKDNAPAINNTDFNIIFKILLIEDINARGKTMVNIS